jgi:hypothetical protein
MADRLMTFALTIDLTGLARPMLSVWSERIGASGERS